MNILKLSWCELQKAYINGSIKPSQAISAYLKQMQQYSYLNSYITSCDEIAHQAGKEADLRYANGTARPLEGFPIAVKDAFCTKGIRTTAASQLLEHFVPNYESFATQSLWNAGAILLGKTNMDEFAMGSSTIYSFFGTTFNPWIGKHTHPCSIGGSSGGSCASTVSYQSLASLGTDTGGSVRQPAAFGGCVGVRTTYGTISRRGMIAFASNLDQAGVFSRDVHTAAACLDVLMQTDVLDATHARQGIKNLAQLAENTTNITHLRIGVLQNLECVTNKQILNTIEQTVDMFKTAGSRIKSISLKCLDHAIATYYVLTPPQAASNLAMYDGTRYGFIGKGNTYTEQCIDARNHLQEEVKRRILLGNYLLSSQAYEKYYIQALKVKQLMQDELDEIFQTIDLILSPTTPHTAFDLTTKREPHAMYYEDYYTVIVNMAGLCAISIPAGLDEHGMPIGIQLIAPAFREDLLIQAAIYLEKQFNFSLLNPANIIKQVIVDEYLQQNS